MGDLLRAGRFDEETLRGTLSEWAPYWNPAHQGTRAAARATRDLIAERISRELGERLADVTIRLLIKDAT